MALPDPHLDDWFDAFRRRALASQRAFCTASSDCPPFQAFARHHSDVVECLAHQAGDRGREREDKVSSMRRYPHFVIDIDADDVLSKWLM